MKKLFTLLAVFLFMSGVYSQAPPGYRTIKVRGTYSVSIPEYFNKTTRLNKIASLQYSAPSKELYIIVIDESFKTLERSNLKLNLPIYFKMSVFNILTALKNSTIGRIKNTSRGNLRLMEVEFSGELKSNNVGIFYKVAVVKSPTRFYQIFTWTLKNQEHEFKNVLQQMVDSFKETGGGF